MRYFVVLAVLALGACQTPAQRAASDDSACAQMGAPKGSPPYFQCRMFKEQQHARADDDLSNSLMAMSAIYNQPAAPRFQTTCTSRRVGGFVQTDCD